VTDAAADGIRRMFDRIAPRYDRLNTVFSLDRDRAWRRQAATLARLRPGQTVVDLCSGTGKLAHELLREVEPGGEVIGIDFSPAMLEVARAREPRVRFLQADVTALPLPDGAADAVTIAFGYRNLVDRVAGLREMRRILKPGGRVVILEFTPPASGPLLRAYRLYLERVMPAVAGAIHRSDGDAYRYLASTVEAFPRPEEVSAQLAEAGFERIEAHRLTFGIAGLHAAVRP
jgi:demethylmenaquinone methyltransferase / 2-methoxy-6-polyprenyl-1,4-benzoquinol methylase